MTREYFTMTHFYPLYMSALHHSVVNNNMQIVEYLVKYVNVDFQDINEKTPLHYAYEHGNEKIVNLLINNGADQEICDIIPFYFYFNF